MGNICGQNKPPIYGGLEVSDNDFMCCVTGQITMTTTTNNDQLDGVDDTIADHGPYKLDSHPDHAISEKVINHDSDPILNDKHMYYIEIRYPQHPVSSLTGSGQQSSG